MSTYVYIIVKTYLYDHCGPEIHAVYTDPGLAIDVRTTLQQESERIRVLTKPEREKIPFEQRLIENYDFEIEKWEVV